MTQEQASNIWVAVWTFGTLEVRDDYSGRAMYGKTTYAIVARDPKDFRLAAKLAGYDPDDFTSDSMGLSVVYY